ncbi:MAG: zinc metallopeptidase [Candidatus Limisoma sp.]
MYFILFIGIAIASYVVQASLNSKFKKYSRITTDSGLTGAEVAERMLREHGINDVKVTQISGTLTDHYNPSTHTVNLSREVYYGNSVASAAVAAHECGHALQHATRYSMLQLRSALVPAVSLSSQIMPWILLAGILTITIFPAVMLLGIILFALTTLFSFVTLPVEINASRRAIAWLNNTGITRGQNTYFAQDALKSAAYTYVVAALSSLATLIYYVMIFMGRRD